MVPVARLPHTHPFAPLLPAAAAGYSDLFPGHSFDSDAWGTWMSQIGTPTATPNAAPHDPTTIAAI